MVKYPDLVYSPAKRQAARKKAARKKAVADYRKRAQRKRLLRELEVTGVVHAPGIPRSEATQKALWQAKRGKRKAATDAQVVSMARARAAKQQRDAAGRFKKGRKK